MANDLGLEMRRRNQIFGDEDELDDESRYTGGIVPTRSENGRPTGNTPHIHLLSFSALLHKRSAGNKLVSVCFSIQKIQFVN